MALEFKIENSPWSPGRVCLPYIARNSNCVTLFYVCWWSRMEKEMETIQRYQLKKALWSEYIFYHWQSTLKRTNILLTTSRPPPHCEIYVDKASTQNWGTMGEVIIVSAEWITDAIDFVARGNASAKTCTLVSDVFKLPRQNTSLSTKKNKLRAEGKQLRQKMISSLASSANNSRAYTGNLKLSVRTWAYAASPTRFSIQV